MADPLRTRPITASSSHLQAHLTPFEHDIFRLGYTGYHDQLPATHALPLTRRSKSWNRQTVLGNRGESNSDAVDACENDSMSLKAEETAINTPNLQRGPTTATKRTQPRQSLSSDSCVRPVKGPVHVQALWFATVDPPGTHCDETPPDFKPLQYRQSNSGLLRRFSYDTLAPADPATLTRSCDVLDMMLNDSYGFGSISPNLSSPSLPGRTNNASQPTASYCDDSTMDMLLKSLMLDRTSGDVGHQASRYVCHYRCPICDQ